MVDMAVRAVVLGSAAGGGFPQWNSNAAACHQARRRDAGAEVRSQASLAVSAEGSVWFLLNASPDLRSQIASSEFLWPSEGLRSSPIAGVVLTGADVDAVAGLLSMRERQPFALYATEQVQAALAGNPIFDVLAPDCVERRVLPLDRPVPLTGIGGYDSRLDVLAFPVPGKVPLWCEGGRDPGIDETGHTIGLAIAERGFRAHVFFVPGCAAMTPDLARRLHGASAVFFDGTLWQDDEMIRLGVGDKTGRRMGHMSMSGDDGAIAGLRDLAIGRKIFVHINNTNPVLLEGSPERAAAEAAGWTIAHDGLKLTL
jgi:pyrroloquinoline quinone biosynthesis protein B